MPLFFMATDSLISVEEYLHTSYRPDCDCVDGLVLERNLGEYDHARLQIAIGSYYFVRRKEWGVNAVTEQRVQISPTRVRIPAVCGTIDPRPQAIFRTPP